MKLLRRVVWSPWDIAILKWCCLLLGMLLGAYCADFARRYALPLAAVALALAGRAAYAYFSGDEQPSRQRRG